MTPIAKRLRVAFVLALEFTAVLCANAALAGGWRLVFSDDFKSGTLDRSKWATRYIYNNETVDHFHDELERYRDDKNHVLQDGHLELVARPADQGLFSSGMIRSYQTFYYGYFEARVMLPPALGVWPAFWLVGDYDSDGEPQYPPEIDIFEFANNGVEDTADMLHSAPVATLDVAPLILQSPAYHSDYSYLKANSALPGSWHTAGMVWAPDKVSFFWDGELVYSRKYQWLQKDGRLGPPAHVLLNLAVGGSWAGRHGVDRSAFPQAFKVDHVLVCQFTSLSEGEKKCGGSDVTPDSDQFGYSSDVNDLAKPTFLPTETRVRDRFARKGDRGEEFVVHMLVPAQSSMDRNLCLSLVDEDRHVVSNKSISFVDLHRANDRDANWSASLDVPFGLRGHYELLASVNTTGHLPRRTPVACQTGVVQPVKGLSCKVASVRLGP